jgi:hypothetical protein
VGPWLFQARRGCAGARRVTDSLRAAVRHNH